MINGDERVIGRRTRGQFFGEVPMTLSTPFPASGRAAESARIAKIDVAAYYALAAQAPSVPARVASLATRYLDSLQAMAAERASAELRVVGPRLDAATHVAAGFLSRNQVGFDRTTLDAPVDGERYPIVERAGAPALVAPSLRELAEAAGLAVRPSSSEYDLVIVGAGPAGLTAAVNAAAEGLRTIVIEALAPGGQAGTSTRIENYTGFPFGISGDDLASRALKQAKRLGAELVVTRSVVELRPGSEGHELLLDGGDVLRTPVVILATGVAWRTLALPDAGRLLGSGVYYGAARSDAAVAQGADVLIIGAGNSAGQAAIFFSRHARSVTMLVRGTSLEASMSRYLIDQIAANGAISVQTESEVVGLHGATALEGAQVLHKPTGSVTKMPASVMFVMIGADATTDWLPGQIERDTHGYVLTGADVVAAGGWSADRPPFALESSVPGVFAIGDVRSGSVKRVAAGVGEGGMAVAFVHQYLAAR